MPPSYLDMSPGTKVTVKQSCKEATLDPEGNAVNAEQVN